jgi:rod shape-determining protein MreC
MANGSLRLARNRGGVPLSLAICAVFAAVLVLLGRVQPTLFDRARAYASDRAAPVLEAVRAPIRSTGQWLGSLADLFDVYQANLRLKEQNARLRQWQSTALALQQRLGRYERLLHAVPDPAVGSVTAHVIGRANRPFLNTMILDAGRRQHVKPGEAVVDDRGMIGRIFLVGDHTSWVILLTDLSSRIPVAIEPGNVQALMSGDDSPAPRLEVSALGAHLREGEQVVTSGDGALLPAGIAVGKVHRDGQEFRASLFADAGRADDVRVLDLIVPAEKPPTPTPADLPVSAARLAPLAPPPPKVTQPAAQQTAAKPPAAIASTPAAKVETAGDPHVKTVPRKPAEQSAETQAPTPDDQ